MLRDSGPLLTRGWHDRIEQDQGEVSHSLLCSPYFYDSRQGWSEQVKSQAIAVVSCLKFRNRNLLGQVKAYGGPWEGPA